QAARGVGAHRPSRYGGVERFRRARFRAAGRAGRMAARRRLAHASSRPGRVGATRPPDGAASHDRRCAAGPGGRARPRAGDGGAGLRTYRVSRIEEAKVLDRPVERPADFDLAAYWRSSSREFEEGWPRCDALLRLEPHTARWMETWRVASIVEAAEAGDPAGW